MRRISIAKNIGSIVFRSYFDPRSSYWAVARRQAEVLSWTKISRYDRPGMKEYLLPTTMERLKEAHPLIFDFGTLSTDCGTDKFLRNINDRLTAFRDQESLFSRIFVPIELDVQVGNGCLQLAKDLDNIMLHLCSKIGFVLLAEGAYVSGYRAYLVNNLSRDSTTRIQVQLLPQGAIQNYSRHIEKAVKTSRILERRIMVSIQSIGGSILCAENRIPQPANGGKSGSSVH